MCGGTQQSPPPPWGERGLSPRVRGNHVRRQGFKVRCGSIPACAGEPVPPCRKACQRGVYPRVCGGTTSPDESEIIQEGLSPRVRGNPGWWAWATSNSRSIPACAGEPAAATVRASAISVYPRVCGGTGKSRPWFRRRTGLSPRVRGNQELAREMEQAMRSIPACAGEPSAIGGNSRAEQVYPRVCGGTDQMLGGTQGVHGLSPRVRGNLVDVFRPLLGQRSIPACAGEPHAGVGR